MKSVLMKEFGKYGDLDDVTILGHGLRRYAFVNFRSAEAASAVSGMDPVWRWTS